MRIREKNKKEDFFARIPEAKVFGLDGEYFMKIPPLRDEEGCFNAVNLRSGVLVHITSDIAVLLVEGEFVVLEG